MGWANATIRPSHPATNARGVLRCTFIVCSPIELDSKLAGGRRQLHEICELAGRLRRSDRIVRSRNYAPKRFAHDRRTPVFFDMLDDQFGAASMADVRKVARIVERIGQIPAQGDVQSEINPL